MSEQQTMTDETPKRRGRKSKENAAPAAGPKPKTFTEMLPVDLTAEDIALKGREAADLQADIEELEEKRKEVSDDYKAKVATKEAELRDTLRAIRRGEEEREVEMRETFVFATNTVQIHRVDTGELVRERAMNADERQPELPLAPTEPAPSDDDEITAPGDLLDAASADDGDEDGAA